MCIVIVAFPGHTLLFSMDFATVFINSNQTIFDISSSLSSFCYVTPTYRLC